MNRTRSVFLNAVYILFALLVTGVIAFATFQPIVVLPRIRLAPGFAFTEVTSGETHTSADQTGRLTFYTFAAEQCDAPCLQTSDQIAELNARVQAATPEDVEVDVITIWLDETPPASAEPAASNAVWVHGQPLKTKYVVGQGFRVFYDHNPETESISVTPRVVLVDGLGIIRAEYRTGLPDTEIINRDIDLLAKEIRNQTTAFGKIGYEAAHLFVCYP